MLDVIIWWIGLILAASMLFRGFCGRMTRQYPFFYIQMSFMLFLDLPCYIVYAVSPKFYYELYWILQFVTMFVACGVILEIINHVLSPNPVVRDFAKGARFVLGFVILGFGVAYLSPPGAWRGEAANVYFERDFRAVQSVFLLVILGAAFYYGLPIGRNLKGLFLGYGLYVGASLVLLSIQSYVGSGFAATWYFLQPLAYVISLAIWLVMLWTCHPNPVPWAGIEVAPHNESLVSRTRLMMGAMRSYVAKAVSA